MAETLEYLIQVRGGSAGAAQVRKLESAVGAAGGTMTRFSGATEKAAKRGTGFTSGLKGMLVQLGLVAGAYRAVSAAKGAVAYTKTLTEGSAALDKATGLGIQRSSQLVAVAGALDIPVGALTTGFKTLSKDAVKQAEATGKSKTAFDRLGISTNFVKGHQHNFNAILDKTLERLAVMPSGIHKNTLQTELFGKSFVKLNPLLGEGVGHLHHLLGIANKYGAELKGTDATKQLEELREAQVESRLASDGLRISFTKLAGPSMVSLLHGFARLKNDLRTNNMGDFGKQIGKVAEIGEKAFVVFEEHAIEGMGQTGPKLANALWRGFKTASTQNQGLMIGAILLKFGIAGKAFGFVGGHLADYFVGSFRRRSVKGVAGAAATSAAVTGAESSAFSASGKSLGGIWGKAFIAGAAALGIWELIHTPEGEEATTAIFGGYTKAEKKAKAEEAKDAKRTERGYKHDLAKSEAKHRGSHIKDPTLRREAKELESGVGGAVKGAGSVGRGVARALGHTSEVVAHGGAHHRAHGSRAHASALDGDIVIKVGERELARISKRTAMRDAAAGA